MADVKISGLPASTTPLAGTEVLPIVQSGVTKKVAVSDLTAGRAVSVLSLTSTNDATISGLTVGKGAGSGAGNTALGASALASNSSANSTAVGFQAGFSQTSPANGFNTYVGYKAGTSNLTSDFNTYVGGQAGQNATGNNNTFVGLNAGNSTTTGSFNTFIGSNTSTGSAGQAITTGAKNTIVGPFSGNGGGLDIRTASNYVVLSDGDGNPRAYHNATDWVFPASNLVMGTAAKGIDFSINPNPAGATSELLNDYEEGTYTATITCSASGTVTLNAGASTLAYTKIGRQVTITGYISVSSVASPVGNFAINIPFAIANLGGVSGSIGGSLVVNNAVAANAADFVFVGFESGNSISVFLGDANTVQSDSAQELKATSEIYMSVTYFTA
jgi:hypothetical protein